MSKEPMISIPTKKYKQMHEEIERLSTTYQERIQRQVEIINRLQDDLRSHMGYKMLASVLMDRIKNQAEMDCGEDLEEFSIGIRENEMDVTNPESWVGKMEEDANGDAVFVIRLTPVPGAEIPMKEDGTPDINKMNEQIAEALGNPLKEETGDSNVHE